ncbi:MAG: hypothetical protein ABIZ09_19110, partial [Rhodoferax sp.]
MTLRSKIRAVQIAFPVIAVAMLVLSGQIARAADEVVLAQTSGCLACHRGLEKRIGPPYQK